MINQEHYPQSIYKFTNNFIRVTIPYTDGFVEYHASTMQATMQATPQDKVLAYCIEPKTRTEIQEYLDLKNRDHFRKSILNPLIESGKLLRTIPDKPTSPNQQFYTASKYNKGDNND
jgi:ATP-dependent DNA helicase RecG